MASAAAERYFNSLPPSEQQRAVQSWNGADRKEEWFQNAVGAGAVGPDGNPRDPNAGAGSVEAQQTGYTSGQSANVSGASGLRKGMTPTPGQLRQWAKETNRPEDYDRFNDATLQDWINRKWDPQAMGFRSDKLLPNGQPVPGIVDKPDDVPEGYTAWGQGAIRNEDLPAWAGGKGKGGAAPAAAGGMAAPTGPSGSNDLIDALKTHAGYFSQFGAPTEAKTLAGGGIQWTDQAANSGPAAAPGAAALTAATLNAFSPQAPSKVAAGAGAPPPPGGYSDPYENAKAGLSNLTAPAPPDVRSTAGTPGWVGGLGAALSGQGLAGQGGAGIQPAAAPIQQGGAEALQAALGRRFVNQDQWWKNGGVAGRQQVM